MWMSVRSIMEDVVRHVPTLLAHTNVPVALGSYWQLIDEVVIVSDIIILIPREYNTK